MRVRIISIALTHGSSHFAEGHEVDLPEAGTDSAGLREVLLARLAARTAEEVVEDAEAAAEGAEPALQAALKVWETAVADSRDAFLYAVRVAEPLGAAGAVLLIDGMRRIQEEADELQPEMLRILELAGFQSGRGLDQGEAASADPATSAPDAPPATDGAEVGAIDPAEVPAPARETTEADGSDASVVANNPEGGAGDAAPVGEDSSSAANEAPEGPVEVSEDLQSSETDSSQRDGAAVARLAHNQEVDGANPSPAPNPDAPGDTGAASEAPAGAEAQNAPTPPAARKRKRGG